MDYITIFEYTKDNTMCIYYCQWDTNEEELRKLFQWINSSDSEVKDDTSYFSYYEKTLPGSYVDELFSQERDDGELYQYKKYSGHFKCPVYDLSGNDPNKLTLTLETLFHTDQLNKCFVPKIGLVE